MQDVIRRVKTALAGLYPDSEITNLVRFVIEHVTELTMPVLLSDKNIKITPAQKVKIDGITKRLQTFEPIQYITGETEFYGLPFIVNNSVLIPRPETEELLELILSENKSTNQQHILDIGTGSGAIAITLKKYLPASRVEAWDISSKAIDVAVLNSKANSVDVLFKEVDILSDYPTDTCFDIIVSNPPYVLDSEKETMSENVLNYEPHLALFVPDSDPLLFYDRIADVSKFLFRKNGILYFEINRQKGSEIVSMLHEKGYHDIRLIKDISGNERIVKAQYRKPL